MVSFAQFRKVSSQAEETAALFLKGDRESRSLTLTPPKKSTINHGRVWELFLHLANGKYGEERVQRIFRKYAVEPQDMIQQNAPLLVRHVHMVEVGASLLCKKELREILGKKVDDPSTLQRFLAQQRLSKPLDFDSSRLMGGPTNLSAFFFHDRYLMDRELHHLFGDVAKLKKQAYLERMCKSVLAREMPKGLIVPAPHPTNKGQAEYYQVYDVVTVGDGLVAYAFKPLFKNSELPPMILFRSSPFYFSAWDLFETWLNNLQRYIGWLGYQTARGKLAKLAHDVSFCPDNKGLLVGGYSLGGVHAQLFIADHPEKVSEAVFFNDPSIDAETADMFAAAINAKAHLHLPMKVRMYRTEGDLAHYTGEKHLFCGVDHPEIDIRLTMIKPHVSLDAKESHGWKHFDTPEKNYTDRIYNDFDDLFRELDNEKRGEEVRWYENLRRVGSYFIFPIFFLWSRFFHLLEAVTGLQIVRHSGSQRVLRKRHS